MADKGLLAIDKPVGITSFDVIRRLRKITQIKKIGHTGTLDPFASGLLICLLGSCTRLASIGEAEDKSYLATMKLGISTSTGDTEGEIVATATVPDRIANFQSVRKAALELTELQVPAHSAIKINGTRAYKYARQNIDIDMPVRPIRIGSFDFIPDADGNLISSNNEISYQCTVSKGTYIRSLSIWLAEQFGCLGHTTALRRTSIGKISLSQATALDELSASNWQDKLCSPRLLLGDYPEYILSDAQCSLVQHGNPVTLDAPDITSEKPVALYNGHDVLIALARRQGNTLKPYLVLP